MKLFHYTNSHGLLGIMNNREIWASDIAFMNDHQEFFEGFNILKQIVNDETSTVRESADKVLFALQALTENMGSRAFWGNYNSLCFSDNPDVLDMWRGYSPGIQKYAIEFDVNVLMESASANYSCTNLIKCVYSTSQKRKLIEDYLSSLSLNSDLTNWNKSESSMSGQISTESIQRFIDLSLTFKNSGFHRECESRILILTKVDEEIHHRVNNFGITPFVKIRLPEKCIHGIWIGPTVDSDGSIYSLKSLFLKHKELLADKNAKIHKSNISFRD